MVLISILITLSYLMLIGGFVYGFDRVKTFKLDHNTPKTTFSVIIPFRNEAEHLPALLESITALKYPRDLFEIILVDDDSEDHSVEQITRYLKSNSQKQRGLKLKVIKNKRISNSPKKDAITTAIHLACSDWIITTDADCLVPKHWLNCFDGFIRKTEASCVVAPVTYSHSKGTLEQFQTLDLLSLQGATLGAFGMRRPFLCNGANFAYKKALFLELKGFEGNTNIASGDDIFLLEKIAKTFPQQLGYLRCKAAIIQTRPQLSWNALIRQRIRWAAKTSAYNNGFGKLTGGIVLLMNGLIVSGIILSLPGIFDFKMWCLVLVVKAAIDFLLVYKTAVFLNQKSAMRHFMIGLVLYPFFSFYVAFASLFTTYTWKGRTFKK